MITPIQFHSLIKQVSNFCLPVSYYDLKISPNKSQETNLILSIFFSKIDKCDNWELDEENSAVFENLVEIVKHMPNIQHPNKEEDLSEFFHFGTTVTARPETVKLFFLAVNQKYQNFTGIDSDGNLLFKPAIDEKIIEQAISAVRWYRRHQIKGAEGVVVETGDDGNGLKIARLRFLFFFHFVYDANKQVTLYNVLDSKNGVVIVAKWFWGPWKKYHVFFAPYDEDLELHGPFTFLGALVTK